MTTLYIIGNGFDIVHNLKTSYRDFRNYLKKYANEFLIALENMHGIIPYDESDMHFGQNRNIKKFHNDQIFKTLWKNFEYNLGEVNEAEMLDYSETIVNDLVLDSGPVAIKDTLDAYWEEKYNFIEQLNEYTFKWIRQVRLSKAVPKKTSFIDNSRDFFFTFNYTSVLERIYHVPNDHILHIHGGIYPYCDMPPILGHGNEKVIRKYRNKSKIASDEYDEGKESILNAIANYYERTWKNTANYIEYNADFFKKLIKVKTISIFGHSFGLTDMPYFIYIKQCVSSNAYWKFYYYSSDDYDSAKKVIKKLKLDNNNYALFPSTCFLK